jgi:hypothetical protein
MKYGDDGSPSAEQRDSVENERLMVLRFGERFCPKFEIRGARGIRLPPNNGFQSDAPPAARA